MHTTETLNLQVSALPQDAKQGCKVTFGPEDVEVVKGRNMVLQGWRYNCNRLWQVPIVDKPPEVLTTTSPKEQYAMASVQVNSPNYTVHLANI
eukprot:3610315-Ditylum_brightwellii.AAC.1